MKMCNDNWSIRVDWPLKHVNNGRRKVKKKPIFLPNLLSFMSLTAKRGFVVKSESLSSGIISNVYQTTMKITMNTNVLLIGFGLLSNWCP